MRGGSRGGRPHHRMGCCCGSVGLARWEERIGFASKSSKLLLKTKQRCSLVSVCWGSSCFVIWISVEITQITTETDYSNVLCTQGPCCVGHPCVWGLHRPGGLCLLWTCRYPSDNYFFVLRAQSCLEQLEIICLCL